MFNVISSIDRAMLRTYLKSSMVNCQDNFHWLQSFTFIDNFVQLKDIFEMLLLLTLTKFFLAQEK